MIKPPMTSTNKADFLEKHHIQVQAIRDLVEKARLERDQNQRNSNTLLEKAFEMADQIGYLEGKANSLRELSVNLLQARTYASAVKSLEQAAHLFKETGDFDTYRKCLNELSDIYYLLGDYELALERLYDALQVSTALQKETFIAEVYNKVGIIYKVIGEYQKAIEQHRQALQRYEKAGDEAQVSITNYYIGNCYNWADELDVALNYLEKSLKSAQVLRDQALKISPLGSLAILFTKTKNYAKAEEYFVLAVDAVDHTGNLKLKADLLKSLGNLYLEQKLFSKSISTLLESLQIAEKLDLQTPSNQVHFFLSQAYERTGDYQQALHHLKRFSEISREIAREEIAIKTKGIQLKFDLEEIKSQKELAEHSARLKDRFLSTISHELRTPLNGVVGMANLLADTHPSPEQLEYINTIKLSANNLISIIDEILDYSRIKSGEVILNEERFALPEMIGSLAQGFKSLADKKQLRFSLALGPGIPGFVKTDKARLSQILSNLLSNSVKYTDKGSVSLEVNCEPLDDRLARFRFDVTDTGIGIPEERLAGIFESFAGENEEKTTQGTGLGLAIVRQLVDLLKGTIHVKSRLHEGSKFTVEITLPYDGPVGEGKSLYGQTAQRELSDVYILLVEDNKVNQFLGKQILTKLGFQVQLAGNGQEALDIISKDHFDLVLMDVNMPVMNGYDLTRMIRNSLPEPKNQVPIVALTAYASTAEKQKAFGIGMNDYITKPYSPQELLHVIVRQLNLKPVTVQESVGTEQPGMNKVSDPEKGPLAVLRQLMHGNEQDLKKMIAMYREQIPSINQQLQTAISGKQWEDVFQHAHKLKSSIRILNISRMTELITMIEEYSKSRENTELINPLYEAFKKECATVLEALKAVPS